MGKYSFFNLNTQEGVSWKLTGRKDLTQRMLSVNFCHRSPRRIVFGWGKQAVVELNSTRAQELIKLPVIIDCFGICYILNVCVCVCVARYLSRDLNYTFQDFST